jgi:hypothetical protein
MQKVMRGLAMLVSIAVLALMVFDLRRFIFVKNINAFSIDSPLTYIIFVGGALAVFLVLNGIQDMRWLKLHGDGDDGGDTKEGACALLWVAAFMAGIFLYIYIVQYLHFLLTTFIFMALGMFLLNDSGQKVGVKLARVLLAAVITVPVLYACFNYVFDVVLP